MTELRGHFVWYELMAADMAAAKAFYAKVVGFGARDASAPGMPYTLLMAGETAVGGLMMLPEEARRMGAKPRWLGYIAVDDVDASTRRIEELGGTVHIAPADIPGVGRFSVVADPQHATLALIKPLDGASPADALDKPGHVGWHELLAADSDKAFALYAELFGWRKAELENNSDAAYQPFAAGGQTIGGLFTKPPIVANPFWLYYFNVADIALAATNVTALGGKILEGPVDVPGGSRVARCEDPQGAMFALMEKRKDKAVGYFAGAAPLPSGGRRWSW
jgi:predicted enzyme related to lactoylglutathione lyase